MTRELRVRRRERAQYPAHWNGGSRRKSSSNRCDVLEILAGSGLDPLATNVVAIAFAKAHLVAELSRMYCSQCRHREILLGVGHFQADARNPWAIESRQLICAILARHLFAENAFPRECFVRSARPHHTRGLARLAATFNESCNRPANRCDDAVRGHDRVGEKLCLHL